MKPRNRRDIIDICQSNFWSYSTLTKVLVVVSMVLSASMFGLYLCLVAFPIASGIICGDIVGWNILWKSSLAIFLYFAINFVDLIFVSIGGSAVCMEENWNIDDFAVAWLNMNEDFEK